MINKDQIKHLKKLISEKVYLIYDDGNKALFVKGFSYKDNFIQLEDLEGDVDVNITNINQANFFNLVNTFEGENINDQS